MRLKTLQLALISIAFLVWGQLSLAADYYFSTTGNDAADCSQPTPCQKVSKMNSMAGSGVTLNLKRGDTWTDSSGNFDAMLTLADGTAGSPVVVTSYGSGAAPILNAETERVQHWTQVRLDNRDYVTIQNLYFKWATTTGTQYFFRVQDGSEATNIIISGNTLIGTTASVGGMQLDHISGSTIENNWINTQKAGIILNGRATNPSHDIVISGNTVWGQTGSTDGISLHEGIKDDRTTDLGSNFVLSGNTVTGAFDCYDMTSGNSVIVVNNWGFECRGDGFFGDDWSNDGFWFLRGNVMRSVKRYGYFWGAEKQYVSMIGNFSSVDRAEGDQAVIIYDDNATYSPHDIRVANNTFDADADAGAWWFLRWVSFATNYGIETVKMKNNIFYEGVNTSTGNWNHSSYPPDYATYEWDYNLYYNSNGEAGTYFRDPAGNPRTNNTLAQFQVDYTQDVNGVWGDPLFVDSGLSNYTLQSGSPAIDAGTWLTTILSSPSGSGTSITVADPYWFHDGVGLTTGDVVKTAAGQEATITDIVYADGSITLNASISYVTDEGIALTYNGTKPDIGAYEYTAAAAASPGGTISFGGSGTMSFGGDGVMQ